MTNEQVKQDLAKAKKILDKVRFRHTDKVQPDKIFFTIDNETVGTEGNLVTLTGLPKAGKSTFLAAAIASAISKQFIFGLRFHLNDEDDRIGYFDTEQSRYSFKKLTDLIIKLSGSTKLDFIDKFLCKEFESDGIVYLIDRYLQMTPNCRILIIDGLLDMLENMNDESQAKKVIKTIKKWGKVHRCLIVGVLHVGKKDGFSLGHLGSATDRYSQSVLIVEKNSKDKSISLKEKLMRESGGFEEKKIMYLQEARTFIQVNAVEALQLSTKK